MQNIETLPVYDSSQRKYPALEEFQELLRYRHLILQTIRRNIVVRYKRSVLGIAWTMLNPLGMSIILAIVFSQVFGGVQGYAAYVLSGLIVWNFFSQSTSDAMSNLVWGGDLLKRIYLPRTVFAVSSVGTGLINLALSLVPLLLVMVIFSVRPRLSILLLPIPILFLAMFALGVGLFLSSFAIQFVDILQMYQIVLTAWMYLTPIIYTVDILPPQFLWLVYLNPMYYLVTLFRTTIYEGRIPGINEFLISGSIALITLLIGWFVFAQKADEFAYRI